MQQSRIFRKTELDAVKVKLSEALDVPVEKLNNEYMERVRTDRAAELIADTQELKTLKAETGRRWREYIRAAT